VKARLGPLPYIYPIPITLVGANVEGRPNFETIGDTGLAGIDPPLVFVSSHRDHYTNLGILASGTFSINFPTTAMLARVDFCGTVSGRDADKSALFEVFYGDTGTAPMIAECPVNLECRLLQQFCIRHRQVFIGEVLQCFAGEEFVHMDGGRPRFVDLPTLDPILYALDNQYYRVGARIGTGYQEAEKWKGDAT